ncbi:MAG: serine/threonine protein kinase, partial [Actinobacteria bacterium]|nr:serine/threonine protein kinase [Actinomycetota bacterium]
RDEMLGRVVAIKIFREGAADASRTVAETRMLAGLNHPALVTLFDAHVGLDGTDFLVMEYVEGSTLRELIAQGPVPSSAVVPMARDLADALQVVHAAGIVHRDIKPSNVLLRPAGPPGPPYRPKLADFGIAHLIDSTRLTMPGTFLGSAAYLSPEQVMGVTPAPSSDVYSLGLLLHEALTGQRSFAQPTAHEAALARLSSDPEISPIVSDGWRELLHAMTQRDAVLRPSAHDVAVALERLDLVERTGGATLPMPRAAVPNGRRDEPALSSTLVMSPGLVPPVQVPRRSRRKLFLIAGVTALILATAGAAGVALSSGQQAPVVQPSSSGPREQVAPDTPAATVPPATVVVPVTQAPATGNNGNGGNDNNGKGNGGGNGKSKGNG